jgi:hypothetical protein
VDFLFNDLQSDPAAVYRLEELVKNALHARRRGQQVDTKALANWQRALAVFYTASLQDDDGRVAINRRRLSLVRKDDLCGATIKVGTHTVDVDAAVIRDYRNGRKLPPSRYPQYLAEFLS